MRILSLSTQLLVLSFLFFIIPFKFSAQDKHDHGHEHKQGIKDEKLATYIKSLPKDGDSLKGFDVKWVMERAAKKGVSKLELPRYIELKKKKFLELKYGIKQQDSFNAKIPGSTPVVNAACTNMDFETGNTSGWTLTSGQNSNSQTMAGCCGTPGGQATIMSGAGTDGCGGFPVLAPGGGTFSCMLGDGATINMGEVNRMVQTFQVATTNQILTVNYAAVLQDGGHTATEQPYFNMQVLDGNGNLLPCGNYNVVAGSGGVSGWQNSGACASTSYLPWQTVSFDLSSIPVGGNVTVQFTVSDCAQYGHFGYCYIDCFCGVTAIQSSNPCSNGNQQLCAPAGMASYNWVGPAGSGITNVNTQCITVNTQGTYSCSTTQAGGCNIPVMTYSLGTSPTPIAAFTYNQTTCSQTVNFTDNTNLNGSAVSAWNWDFGDPSVTTDVSSSQNPSYTYTNAGTYTATLTITSINGCTSTSTQAITVTSAPTAIFTTPPDVCNGSAVTFNNTSTTPAGTTITSYEWDFTNDGIIDNTTASPVFTYASPGTFTAELTITNSGGCSNTTTQQIIVHAVPVANFTSNAVCLNTATTFTDNSTIGAPGTISGWSWDFTNDGVIDNTTQSPTFIFPASGTFTTELTVTGEAPTSCASTFTLVITVNPNPVSNFTAPAVCFGNNTLFTNLSSVAAPDNITSSTWNFGDGNASVAANPAHTYAACGTYNSILTVITNNGCNATFNTNVIVNCIPAAAFSNTNVCLNSTMPYTDISTVNGSTIAQWQWDFSNDGSVDNTTQNPTFVFPSSGTFNTELIVTGANGCSDTVVQPVTVFPNPQVSFTTVNACDQSPVNFNNQTTINNPDIISTWAWDFDNNGTIESALQSPTYIYPGGAGTYNVTLTATSNNSCVSSASIPVTVFANPAASFTATTVCEGTASVFTDGSSIVAGNTISNWAWDFDNNGSADNMTQNPNFTFPASGAQNVELLVTTNNGCSDSISLIVNVNPNPVANFSVTSVCFGNQSVYTDLSTINAFNGSAINSWNWDFDFNSTTDNTTQNPSNIFSASGTMNTELTVTSNFGCVGSVILPATIYPLPVADFSSDPNCQNAPVQYTDLSTVINPGSISNWSWDLNGDGNSDSNIQHPSQTYANAGAMNITLIVTTLNGCKDTVTKTTTVNPNPVAAFSGDILSGCPVHCVNFTNASTIASGNISQWNWSFGDGSTAQTLHSSNCYTNSDPVNPALFTVSLTVVSDSGCTASITNTDYITVYPEPIADFVYGPTSPEPTVIDPLVNFYNQSLGATTYSWDFGDFLNSNDTSSEVNPVYVYNNNEAETYLVQLAVSNSYGCVDTVVKPIPVSPEFTFYCPNAFTPADENSGDQINDGFRGYGIGIDKYNMWIYDRWGNMIFATNKLEQVWDGKVQGKSNIVQQDVYVWKVKLTDVFGRGHSYIGHVTVIK